MIDVNNIQFVYSKEEVDLYLTEQKTSIEDLLQLLIHAVKSSNLGHMQIKPKARVPVSKFQVGAGMYTSSGRIFLGTNIEIAHAAINHVF